MASRIVSQSRPVLARLQKINNGPVSMITRASSLLTHRINDIGNENNNNLVNSVAGVGCSMCSVVITRGVKVRTWVDDRKKLELADIEARVMKVVKGHDKVDKSKVTFDSHFMNDMGMDSLDQLEIVMGIEDEFMFQINDTDADKLFTPRDVVNFIKKKDDEWLEWHPESELPRPKSDVE
ncbi:uncharacterized protein LOC141857605 [Brevipalpus obovatus]|uniref:uncharacterized protein LOC141857605 n=1 Tax=Brevipalpus obovatus TaxID=246614 RepID=UPI003D9E4896